METMTERSMHPICTTMHDAVKECWMRYAELGELHTEILEAGSQKFPTIRRGRDGSVAGSTGLADCLFLYALVRTFRPKTVFEIGTWVGTSAAFMAEAAVKNGAGRIHTCDANDYYALSSDYDEVVHRMHNHSDHALEEVERIDMLFADGTISRRSAASIARRSHDQTIVAMHDVKLPCDKGVRNILVLYPYLRGTHEIVFPRSARCGCEDTSINNSVGILLPVSNTAAKGIKKDLLYLSLFGRYVLGRASHLIQKIKRIFYSLGSESDESGY